MEWIVQMGFELNIYDKDELGAMYWYATDMSSMITANNVV